ncbi:sortase domain-bontaining protein [Kitasatospora arboriphila]
MSRSADGPSLETGRAGRTGGREHGLGGQRRSPWPGTLAAAPPWCSVPGCCTAAASCPRCPPPNRASTPSGCPWSSPRRCPVPRRPGSGSAAPASTRPSPASPSTTTAGCSRRPRTTTTWPSWYAASTAPGESGTAVLASHVDTADGPAVFYRLGTLHRGDQVEVVRADRTTAHFAVDGVEVYPKKDFPDRKVYGASPNAQLRLITCGGGFTRQHGYDGNVVVYAHLVRAATA